MLLDEIVDLTIERLIAVCMCLSVSTAYAWEYYQLEFFQLKESRVHASFVNL